MPLAVLAAVPVLLLAAWGRGAEYDEQYTLFLTGQAARPDWGDGILTAAAVVAAQAPSFDPLGLARALRDTDVHPPLYFWLASLWRALLPWDLRLLSVMCSALSLALVGMLARRFGAPAALAVVLTAGCYGFAYTGVIARGFALATLLLLLGAVAMTPPRPTNASPFRLILAGAAFGAASATNYLAIFAAAGFVAGSSRRLSIPLWTGLGTAPFLVLDLVFFLAQRGSREGQFPPFDIVASLVRLTRYMVATMFGGLPLYAKPPWSAIIAVALAGLAIGLTLLVLARPRLDRIPLYAAVAAQPAGLLALGLIFNNTPIELRYLAFTAPFAMILLASALAPLPRRPQIALLGLILAIQAASLTGLARARATMQPAREAASAATALAPHGIVLLPRGNDGVGIVGAFARESPPEQPLLLVRPSDDPADLRRRVAHAEQVVIAAIAQDDASRAAIPLMVLAMDDPCWEQVRTLHLATLFTNRCRVGMAEPTAARPTPPSRSGTDPYPQDPPRTSSAPRAPGPGDGSGG